ncbi:MAG: heavy metal translocating P-type ATPase [Cyanobacteriota bacterium]|nr:heavy metal translocating P-type ATPase [Cyanobacteriota bacterium]
MDGTVWKVVQQAAFELDHVLDRAAAALDRTVAPVLQNVAGSVDEAMERTLSRGDGPAGQKESKADSTAEAGEGGARPTLGERIQAIDRHYQEFMVQRVDPLFGQVRTQQLLEMGQLEISEPELMLNRQIAFSGLALVSLVGGQLFAPPTLLITVPASFTLSFPVFQKAFTSVQEQRRVTYHVLSAINVTAIWLSGFYVPALVVAMAFYMGEKLLMVTEDRSQKGLIGVFSQQPRVVIVLEAGQEREMPLKEIATGAIVVVRAGSFMPVDGQVVEGLALVDQHMLTGEAKPVEKVPGDPVYASTMVLAGKLQVRVSCAGDETVAAKIGEVLNQTTSYQLALQSKGSKIAHDFALPTLTLAGVALFSLGAESGLAILNSSFGTSVRMSSPVTMLNLLNIASNNGILLKDGRSLDLLSTVDTVVFDKTGTLTQERPNVAQVIACSNYDPQWLLALAAAAEKGQNHPIALAILTEAEARHIQIPEMDDANYDLGYGLKVKIDSQNVQIGSDRYMAMEGMALPADLLEAQADCHQRGHSLVLLAVDGEVVGAIELQPTIRPEVSGVLQALRHRGLDTVVISGDQEEPTRNLAEQLGINRYFANILPEGKADLVQKLQDEGHVVCFVGDGINDSIALKKSNVSVSLRGATTAATDSAQIILMQESLSQLPFLFELGEDMERSMRLCLTAGMVPGVITVGGVFFLGWGYLSAIFLNMLSLSSSLGIAVYPLYKYRHLANLGQPLRQENESIPASYDLHAENEPVIPVNPDVSSGVEPSTATDPSPDVGSPSSEINPGINKPKENNRAIVRPIKKIAKKNELKSMGRLRKSPP